MDFGEGKGGTRKGRGQRGKVERKGRGGNVMKNIGKATLCTGPTITLTWGLDVRGGVTVHIVSYQHCGRRLLPLCPHLYT